MNHFSIVTVVKNNLEGLRISRSAVESQTYKNWTHIIVDGSSTDGTVDYIKTLPAEKTVYISEADTGIYNAMNKAWKLAEPESFVFFLNARDTFTSDESLREANIALAKNSSSNWGCTTHEEIQQNGEGWICKLVAPPSVPNQLYAFGYRSHQAVVMKASFIESLGGFNEIYKIASDWDLIVKAIKKEDPTIWWNSLGKFELGGFSSNQLLAAHLELMLLRQKYLPMNLKQKIAEQVWCALYLRDLGYRNHWSKIIHLLFLKEKNRYFSAKKPYSKSKVNLFFHKFRPYSGKFKLLGKGVGLFNFLRALLRVRLNKRNVSIIYLHKILGISEYYGKKQV